MTEDRGQKAEEEAWQFSFRLRHGLCIDKPTWQGASILKNVSRGTQVENRNAAKRLKTEDGGRGFAI